MPLSSGLEKLVSMAFRRLVEALKLSGKTVTVVESSCGGLINTSILAQPGASKVYSGGSVAYNTSRAKPFLLGDDALHKALLKRGASGIGESEADFYVRSKLVWTSHAAVAFAEKVGTDFAIAEAGATGPTFRPRDLNEGFSVISVAGKSSDGGIVELLRQVVVRSSHANREANMNMFADAAASLLTDIISESNPACRDATKQTADCRFDRATKLRAEAPALAKLNHTRFVCMHQNSVLVSSGAGDGLELALLSASELASIQGPAQIETAFLGTLDGNPLFSADILGEADASALKQSSKRFSDTRQSAAYLPKLEYELALYSKALHEWQRRSKYCPQCASATELVDGGTSCTCSGCGARTWLRQDPSIIVCVTSRDGSKVLLARHARHPAKVHTVVAGFVEVGERFEDAVQREVCRTVDCVVNFLA